MTADHSPNSFSRIDRPLALLSLGVLLIGLFYTLAYVLIVPYPGFDFNGRWEVLACDNPCDTNPAWCAATENSLRIGDRLTVIGDLTYEEYRSQPVRIPFGGYHPGDSVPITFARDGVVGQTTWPVLGPTSASRFTRLIGILIFLPFWLAGTGILLFLRPRDRLWGLLIAFNYVTAVWIAAGIPSVYHVGGSLLVLYVSTWLLLPVYLHLHLLVPAPIFQRSYRRLIYPLYALGVGMALLSLFKPLPNLIYNMVLLLAMLGSLLLLFFRLFRPAAPKTRLALRLMLVGVALAFGPGVILWVIPGLLHSSIASRVPIIVMMIAISLLPFFYVYALYKHRLGDLEFRANRLLSLFSFLLIYVTTFLFVFVIGSRWIEFSSQALAFALISSVIFVSAALPLKAPFQRFIDRLAYGTVHNPTDIIRAFANEIPRALRRDALVKLLTHEVSPSLLIRQSALYLVGDQEVTLFYADGIVLDGRADFGPGVRQLLDSSGRYRPPEPDAVDAFAWVRLPIAIEVGGKRMGVWLLGQRDPDDYYPLRDVELLITLANQIGVALETSRLFENLQHRATELECAYRDLQKLDQLKDEFVQNVSHELRTPLTMVQGYAELLLEGELGALTSEQRNALDTIADRTQGTIRLVNDVISVQQAALEQVEYEQVNLGALARSSIQAAEIMVRKQKPDQQVCTFVLDTPEDIAPVPGDRRRLSQVLDNLLNNAVKFSPNGGTITVRVRSRHYQLDTRRTDGPQPVVEISVSDQGIGIPADQIDRIWGRFYQVDGSTTRRFGGVGLGLTIAQNIVKAHGGVIWAESAEDTGATFRFVLPTLAAVDQTSADNPGENQA
ncbi:MAG: hypothetical protein CVU38_04345 [Chloroflexi bacterium HGW-Chloroflexi-1]|nr:MAG: hypothetical protein CVU38_04345 [Chloroflexi bacterium HGW-Chloroflexi-1]